MARYDASAVDCHVFTFKEGLLSRVAHDLRLRVTRLTVTVDDGTGALEATFDPASIVVDTAMAEGREQRGALSAGDAEKIEKSLREDVLHVRSHPEVRFRSTSLDVEGDAAVVRGELTLHGTTRPVVAQARRDGGAWSAEVTLHQPDWGITPYRAAFGALKVRPDVRVRIRVPHAR